MSSKKQLNFMDLYNENIEKMCPSYNRNFYVSFSLMILVLILIIVSLDNIEKSNCECAKIPEKRLLKEWFIIALIIGVIFLLFFIFSNEPCYLKFINNNYLYIFVIVFALVNYIMLFRLLLYLRIMRKNCECGYGNLEKFLFWYLVIVFSFVALMVLLGLIMIIVTAIKFSK
jgi:hypothetical protein